MKGECAGIDGYYSDRIATLVDRDGVHARRIDQPRKSENSRAFKIIGQIAERRRQPIPEGIFCFGSNKVHEIAVFVHRPKGSRSNGGKRSVHLLQKPDQTSSPKSLQREADMTACVVEKVDIAGCQDAALRL